MKKKSVVSLIVAFVIIVAISIFLNHSKDTGPIIKYGDIPSLDERWSEENFRRIGYINFYPKSNDLVKGTFAYRENNSTTTKKILFDESSMCPMSEHAVSCNSVSYPLSSYNGRMAELVGKLEGDSVILFSFMPNVGLADFEIKERESSPAISWSDALDWLHKCQVNYVGKTDNTKIYLYLSDGKVFQTSEPEIDEVLNVIHDNFYTCMSVYPIVMVN